jgi:lysozyme
MSTTNIVDGFHGDVFNFPKLKQEGIVGVIHKATQGTNITDPSYKSRRKAAKAAGLLWGAFHFATDSDWEEQVKHFLDVAEPADDEVIAWDYENPPAGQGHAMSFAHVHDAVELISSLTKRFPTLYGGNLIRENVGDKADLILKNCPLWYARYRSTPAGVPKGTWPAATLWQYTAAEAPNQNGPGPTKAGGKLVDRNFFAGSDAELAAAWPFSRKQG